MKIKRIVYAEVNLSLVYSMCTPIDKKECLKQIRSYVRFLLERRCNDADGGWTYPSEDVIAGDLISWGLAIENTKAPKEQA